MRKRTAYMIVALLAALVVACVLLLMPPRATPPPIDGCSEVHTDELYVQHAYACEDGTRVLTFTDVTARDAYAQVATRYGSVIIDEGNAWLRTRGV